MQLTKCILQSIGKADIYWFVNPTTLKRVAKPERYRKVYVCAEHPHGSYKSVMLIGQGPANNWQVLSRGLFDQCGMYKSHHEMMKLLGQIYDENQQFLFDKNLFAVESEPVVSR